MKKWREKTPGEGTSPADVFLSQQENQRVLTCARRSVLGKKAI